MREYPGYETEVRTVPFGKGTMVIENLTPILPPRERERRKREAETALFSVFRKYPDPRRSL